jgi:hypothetical protein
MKRSTVLLLAGAAIASTAVSVALSSTRLDAQASTGMKAGKAGTDAAINGNTAKQVIVTTIPAGYRDWKFVSAAHEAGTLNDIRVVIGNEKAIRAYRAGMPFPEGAIVGRVAWKMVPSEENNRIFGQEQSFVPGDAPDWYLQFMEKNSRKYAATGGWGYSNFGKDLKPTTDEKTMHSCFECHQAVQSRDYIFTRYSP